MITLLGQLDPQRLGVVARTSASFYGGSRSRVRDIARELDVDYIVEGSVRLDGRRVRASVQLIRAADEAHVWTDSYDRDLQDLLDVQHELARAIADRVELTVPPLASRSGRTGNRPTPEAYEAYLRGRYLLERRTADALGRGHAYLQEAVRLDPQFALGYAALSHGYHRLAGETLPPQEAMPRAVESADRSLQLNPDLAEGHAARAMVFASYTWDWAAAERAFRRALDLGPQSVETRIAYASFLSHVGRLDEAVTEAERSLQLDPVSLSGRAQLAVILYRARRYADALEQLERVRELDANFPTTYLNLALVHAARAQHREALAAIERGRALDPESVDLMSIHAFVLGRAGERHRAAAVLDELASRASRQYVHPWTIGLVHLGLGDTVGALDALERGFEQRSWMTTLIKVNPELDPLRGDPRFERLIERMRFPG
jgi:tetratricopeptide (TPR) repeat protein